MARRPSGALPFLGVGHRPGERCVPGLCAVHAPPPAAPLAWPIELRPLCGDASPPPPVGDRAPPPVCDADLLRKESYVSKTVLEALRRVLFRNVTDEGKPFPFHMERLNAYTHFAGAALVGALLALLYALPDFADAPSDSVLVSRVAAAVSVATFFNSGLYHTLKTVPWLNASLLLFDFVMVFAAFASSGFADVYIYTSGFTLSQWQTAADPLLSCGCVVLFLVARHFFFDKTPLVYTNCSMNILRVEVSDGLHNATRSAATFCVVIQPVLLAPALLRLAGDATGWTVLAIQGGAVLLLLAAGFLERNERPALEEWARSAPSVRSFVMAPVGLCGGMCTGHAVWHAASTAAAVAIVLARELLLVDLERGAGGS